MAKHLQRELDALQHKLLGLATLVEDQVKNAVVAVERNDADSARSIIDSDRAVDLLEIEVEEECLKLLALYQPVAVDLRFIIAVLKINNDLERIADLAANIADRAIRLSYSNQVGFDKKLTLMCEKTIIMLRKSLDALFRMDAECAHEVCSADDEIDELNRHVLEVVKLGIHQNTELTGDYLLLLSVSKNLERVADHATNIAEDVIYMINGDIVRHRQS